MSMSAVSLYRGGNEEAVAALSRRMKAILHRYGVGYTVARVQTDREDAEWMVVVQYANKTAYETALKAFGPDPEHKKVVAEIGKIVTLVRREITVDLEL